VGITNSEGGLTGCGIGTYTYDLSVVDPKLRKTIGWEIVVEGGVINWASTPTLGFTAFPTTSHTVIWIYRSGFQDLGTKANVNITWNNGVVGSITVECTFKETIFGGLGEKTLTNTAYKLLGLPPTAPTIHTPSELYVGEEGVISLANCLPQTSYFYQVTKGTLDGASATSKTTASTVVSYRANTTGWETVKVSAINACGASNPNQSQFAIMSIATAQNIIINGPTTANPNVNCNFTVSTNVGAAPYTYYWWFSLDGSKFTPLGGGASITKQMPTSTHLWMKVQSKDALGNILYKTKLVRNNTVGIPTKSGEIEENDFAESDFSESDASLIPDKKQFMAEEESMVSIYPNPSSGVFKISAQNSDARAFVYNTVGEIVWSGELSDYESTIHISAQPIGVYILRVNQGEKEMTKKIFKY
jgi:hypothetical protein